MGVGVGYYNDPSWQSSFNTKDWTVGENPQATGLCPGTYEYTVWDATGCASTIPVLITEGCASDLTVDAGTDVTTYFGISSMQSVTRTVTVSGGTPPYTYSWSLGRPLLCNQEDGNGDESFYGGTCANNTCPDSGSPAETALCSGSETITANLLQPATICVTVSDANGCLGSDCFLVNASDVRCFSGNGTHKVKMCHHTNSNGNPWVEICVDTNAVDAHLEHGDFLGVCDFTKSDAPIVKEALRLHFNLFPNPASGQVTVEFNAEEEYSYTIDISELTGRKLTSLQGKTAHGTNTVNVNLEGILPGIYFVMLTCSGEQEVRKLVIE
jgi:hypothetical protein